MPVKLFNTMSRRLEDFKEINPGEVRMYCCGPTVYNYAHIGNLRTFIFEDILHRTLEHAGYNVLHVMNITDVGHLTGDGDDGEDKMSKRAKETGRSVWDIAKFYTDAFFTDEKNLNIVRPNIVCKATDHVQDMIKLIQQLEANGHTYISGGNVYFSIDTIDDYGKLAKLNLHELKEGARIEVDENKRNPKDFVLWFTKSKFDGQAMTWDSPWGVGYPGWHIECSAMSSKYLGDHFDIHCGGIDAIPVHHTNEIAQSEAACGHKPWVNYWCHGEFLLNDKGKMSKSSGEFLTLPVLIEKGYNPLDYRYFCLTGHYRSQLKFSYEALDQARTAREGLFSKVAEFKAAGEASESVGEKAKSYRDKFFNAMENDLKAPQALAAMWGIVRDNQVPSTEKLTVLYEMDEILGLELDKIEPKKIEIVGTPEALELAKKRAEAKKAKDFALADQLRDEILSLGFVVKDTPQGPVLEKV
ncbi:MAG: cysteine--tRNA ligase [Sphaerochaetaceae bacterium]|nr:cysteine--tRNA ligase [Sphaerochaetaceae bacterium]